MRFLVAALLVFARFDSGFTEDQAQHSDALLEKLGASLSCSACKMAVDYFRLEVARYIKGSMSAKKKQKVFESRLGRVCLEGRYP